MVGGATIQLDKPGRRDNNELKITTNTKRMENKVTKDDKKVNNAN